MPTPPTGPDELEFSFPPQSDVDALDDTGTVYSDELVDDEWTKLNHPHQHQAASDPHYPMTSLSSPHRSRSPMPVPLRFSQQSITHLQRDSSHKSILDSWLARRPSIPTATVTPHVTTSDNATPTSGHSLSSKLKSKDRSLGNAGSSTVSFGYGCAYDAENTVSTFSNPTSSITSTESSPHFPSLRPQSPINPISPAQSRRPRTSLLSAASDALGLRKKIGAASRKKPIPQNPTNANNMMPGVIEISARNNATVTSTVGCATAHGDYEHEERERLRDAAAQSIGLDPELLHDSRRSGSMSSLDSPRGSSQPISIPPFPATLAALRSLTVMSATLPKFTPPSSLLVYALAKQWKLRTILLTSHVVNQKTHIHLFKGASPDEKELERLEITDDSVIFVAEEEVGGRGNVIKVVGKDVGVKRTGAPGEESARTMWFLQITDSAESQRWIAAIKNTILSQRAKRAGLGIATSQMEGGHEPRGDMDVMLSMHMQGLISNQATTAAIPSLVTSLKPSSPSPPPSLRSLTVNVPSPSPTTGFKGIFTATRSRSPSLESSRPFAGPPTHTEESFGAAGASLLTMLRTNTSTESDPSHSCSLPLPVSHISAQDSSASSALSASAPIVINASDLKISKDRDARWLETSPESNSISTQTGSNTHPAPSLSPVGPSTLSLQPPPRKSKHGTLSPIAASPEQHALYKQPGGNRSVAGNFGVPSISCPDGSGRIETDSSQCGFSHTLSIGSNVVVLSPRDDTRKVSVDDLTPTVSRGAASSSPPPNEEPLPREKLTNSIPITKRWSRQGTPLPKQLTPPSGPPPSIPNTPESNHRASLTSSTSTRHHVGERASSSASSNSQSPRGMSPRSGSSLSPTFWKRTSGSSVFTVSSASTSDSRTPSQPSVSDFRSSFGPAIGNGVQSRPISLSVPGLSPPMPHAASTKRRSMPPPRPAPNFAPPPAPIDPESTSGLATSAFANPSPSKLFRNSVAKRVVRLSLTAPKPPPSSALPPRPDEIADAQGHRRSSSSGHTANSSILDVNHSASSSSRPSSALSGRNRSFSLRQRLRMLNAPPVSPTSLPVPQISTLDLGHDNSTEPPTPSFPYSQPSQSFGLGEHITTMQNDPSFLQLLTPITPTIPKPPPRGPFQPTAQSSNSLSGTSIQALDYNQDFISLSPPPRRGSKHLVVTAVHEEKHEVQTPVPAPQEGKLAALSQRGSVVSLGFVTAS